MKADGSAHCMWCHGSCFQWNRTVKMLQQPSILNWQNLPNVLKQLQSCSATIWLFQSIFMVLASISTNACLKLPHVKLCYGACSKSWAQPTASSLYIGNGNIFIVHINKLNNSFQLRLKGLVNGFLLLSVQCSFGVYFHGRIYAAQYWWSTVFPSHFYFAF